MNIIGVGYAGNHGQFGGAVSLAPFGMLSGYQVNVVLQPITYLRPVMTFAPLMLAPMSPYSLYARSVVHSPVCVPVYYTLPHFLGNGYSASGNGYSASGNGYSAGNFASIDAYNDRQQNSDTDQGNFGSLPETQLEKLSEAEPTPAVLPKVQPAPAAPEETKPEPFSDITPAKQGDNSINSDTDSTPCPPADPEPAKPATGEGVNTENPMPAESKLPTRTRLSPDIEELWKKNFSAGIFAGVNEEFIKTAVEEEKLAAERNQVLVTSEGRTLFTLAIENHEYELIDALLKAGIDPNIKDDDKTTPLHYAAHVGDEKLIEKLISANATIDKNELPVVGTPLHLACKQNNPSLIKLLMTKLDTQRSLIDFQNSKGLSPLMIAAFCGNSRSVGTLLKCGANAWLTCLTEGDKVANALDLANLSLFNYFTCRALKKHMKDNPEPKK